MYKIRPSLIEYIENNIIPQYKGFDSAHQESHVNDVIQQALELAKSYYINNEMIYAAAALHDIGLSIGRDSHHIESGRIIRNTPQLKEWFTDNEIETIAQAAEDHRASSKSEPRTIYGKIIAEADRHIEPIIIIKRTIEFEQTHHHDIDKDNLFKKMVAHLNEKYGRNGYLKLWIKESKNAEKLEELRLIIDNPNELTEIFNKIYNNL
ncbi:MAG: HD domain-containing protein [Bacteroidaceae bacterium]|nr:HD domain-containing protein [Bacteroidaceae bacterium]